MKSLRLIGICAALAVATAACSGGGSSGGAVVPAPSNPPVGPLGNQYTSYTVFAGTANNESVIDVLPIGTTSSLPGAKAVAGTVIYPDASVQLADGAGNFDAAQSSWAFLNQSTLLANPANEPLVDVAFFPASGAAPVPEEVSLSAYSSSSNLVPLEIDQASASVELATVAMAPKSAWVEDGHNRLFTLYGRDTTGAPFGLSKAQVRWTLATATGCGAPRGKISALPSDASKAVYSAPASASVAGACADQVVATVTANATTYAGSGSAYFFDPKSSSKLAGTLTDASGKPVANALIDLYIQSADAAQGTLLVNTDVNGRFSRTVPSNRVMAPVVLSIANKKASGNVIAPATIDPRVVSAAALAAQSWKLGATAPVAKPVQPDYAALIHDASVSNAEMKEQLPLDAPAANGSFAAGSIEAILASPAPRATGTVASGDYRKYTYAWDATGTVATFTQPGPASEAETLAVTIHAAKVGANACATGANCYSFTQKHGSMLLTDGAWSAQVASGKYNVTYLSNQYTSTHQAAGSPLYVNTTTLSQTLGSTGAVTLTQTQATASGTVLSQITTTHTPAVAPAVYTYTGSVKNYPSGKTALEVDYSLNNGMVKEDGSGSFQFADSHSPSPADIGVSINWATNTPATASASGNRATGTVDVPGQKGLQSGHSASFTLDQHNVVHLTLDASLGGATTTFQL